MRWFDFFRRRNTASPGASSTNRSSAVVEFDDIGVTCTRHAGRTESVRWAELRAVLIQTTSDGPAVDDLFWVLCGEDSGCVVPSEAQGCEKLLERLQKLPGFDHQAAIEAASCTEEKQFVCWRRE